MAEYASNAKGNLGVALGAVGTGLSILGGGASLMNLVPGQTRQTSEYATREVLDMAMKLSEKNSEIA